MILTQLCRYVHYDFGDAIRTAANIAEDERNSQVKMDIDLFEAYANGYLSETRHLNAVEKSIRFARVDNIHYSTPLP